MPSSQTYIVKEEGNKVVVECMKCGARHGSERFVDKNKMLRYRHGTWICSRRCENIKTINKSHELPEYKEFQEFIESSYTTKKKQDDLRSIISMITDGKSRVTLILKTAEKMDIDFNVILDGHCLDRQYRLAIKHSSKK